MRKFAAVIAACVLSGCTTYSLEELRQVTPSGSEFNQTLTRLYLDYAEQQAKNYDWYDSMIFADKGLLTAYDNEVGPEDLASWNLPLESLVVMEKARADLLVAMSAENLKNRPVIAAEAQFYFDCWVENQEDNTQDAEIAFCRDHFKDRLDELNDTSYKAFESSYGKTDDAAVDRSTYIVFFDWGQAALSDAGKQVVDDVVGALKGEDRYDIVLNGHTDTTGSDQYNQKLSLRRAEAVKARLVEGGVTPENIKIFAFGESDPPVKTKDNVPEKANRRVEIILSE